MVCVCDHPLSKPGIVAEKPRRAPKRASACKPTHTLLTTRTYAHNTHTHTPQVGTWGMAAPAVSAGARQAARFAGAAVGGAALIAYERAQGNGNGKGGGTGGSSRKRRRPGP